MNHTHVPPAIGTRYRAIADPSSHLSDTIYIPAGVPHGFRVGAVPSRKLNIYAPAAMVGYFDELSRAIARDEMDDETFGEIARR